MVINDAISLLQAKESTSAQPFLDSAMLSDASCNAEAIASFRGRAKAGLQAKSRSSKRIRKVARSFSLVLFEERVVADRGLRGVEVNQRIKREML
jgi:hypothetical protein